MENAVAVDSPAPNAEEAEARRHGATATYSPEDNKLRIYTVSRLSEDEYARIKAAGFRWAPKQELWVAPAWTPEREDVALWLAGDIGDEDTSLVERAEERAERFDGYSESRRRDADSADRAARSIADGIPLGQPILVGHHSERRARKDAERIQSGFERAARMWKTSRYWTDRAAGAIAHAKYKELPGVRARRIKGLESDLRKFRKHADDSARLLEWWDREAQKSGGDISREAVLAVLNVSRLHSYELWSNVNEGKTSPADAVEASRKGCRRIAEWAARWIDHTENRLAYERAMLGESGAMAGDAARLDAIKAGGRVRHGSTWYNVLRVNRKAGHVCSVRVDGPSWSRVLDSSQIEEYEEPAEGVAEAVAAAMKKPPLCNYRTDGCREMTLEEYQSRAKSGMAGTRILEATESAGRHRLRTSMGGGSFRMAFVFINDAKEVPAPAPAPKPDLSKLHEQRAENEARTARARLERSQRKAAPAADPDEERRKDAERMAKDGVRVVTAPELFPTPRDLARRMCALAGMLAGRRILEPSAGCGDLWAAAMSAACGADCCRSVCVEVNHGAFDALQERRQRTLYAHPPRHELVRADFLELKPEDLGAFDTVLMNPPFSADVSHVTHARAFVKDRGNIVALLAAGPRQDRFIAGWKEAADWVCEADETLHGAFKPATGVSVRLVAFRRNDADQ